MKITRMHLYPRRQNVAAQVVEELKMVAYATPPMEKRREREGKIEINAPINTVIIIIIITDGWAKRGLS